MQSNINAAKIVVFLDFFGVSQLLQMLIFLKCELCDRTILNAIRHRKFLPRSVSGLP